MKLKGGKAAKPKSKASSSAVAQLYESEESLLLKFLTKYGLRISINRATLTASRQKNFRFKWSDVQL